MKCVVECFHRVGSSLLGIYMRRFLVTGTAATLAVALLLIHFLTGVDFFSAAGTLLEAFPWNHADELLIAVLFIVVGITIDGIIARKRRERETEIQAQRLMVFKATMRSVHELVNDALNQLQLFRLKGEGLMPEESLTSFDDLLERTAEELRALSDLASTPERDTPFGRSIDHKFKTAA